MSTVTPSPRVAVIVVAAGSGTRLGAGAPKAFVGIDDHTILRHCLDRVFAARLAQVVVVAPEERVGEALTDAQEAAGARRELVSVVAGGSTRQQSVAAGLAAVWPDVEIVLVHDAARALAPAELIDRVVDAVERTGWGVVPVLPVVDTIKRVDGELITGVVDRSELASAQTPQGFRRDILETAYRVAGEEHTDDSALVAAAGHPIASVEGDARAFKITTPADLQRARTLISPAPAGPALPRIGVGTDVHAFGGEGALWLAGLEWPGEPALSGHSDGDAVAHAIVDALLSAAGLGDIGSRFGTDRPEFAGAHAAAFLEDTRAHLAAEGWTIGNVSVQVQAARPRFAPRRAEAEAALSAALGGAPVTVSATTTDGLGFTGAAEGVQAFAVALVHRA
ncbi:bifunctional enzyme IspD/IspF [Microbacterium barkeri]|uniref:Bifunctional enzyme IspD/IspF n=1 Tax=Microbacterium barkeri TaxID=33917 RepID=A0A9W6LX50_9MICO|nr:2-C-methyl-D-erythritol 4-phosphate cytidylyltransferase [Microbacterium barkeri]MDR6876949.1 2-C-methyl-D-erythritol 4-phosphate cytidylyltransferase/2-C-methyl-D-erythritol 2,4-cyclodiphosphate synthase [Microbacterium barkeri]GLJ61873.1 bifunctional enzyme IspD/IspF [Microbacterium barkeri]